MIPILFLMSLVLFKLPNIYFIPVIQSTLLTTHVLARLVVFVTLIFNIKNIGGAVRSKQILLIAIMLFVVESVSIIQAENIISFILRYKEICLGLVTLVLSFIYRTTSERFIRIILITTAISVAIQTLALLFSNLINPLLNYVLYDKLASSMAFNLERGRIYFETFDEIAIPIIIYRLTTRGSSRSKVLLMLLLCLVIYTSFASMWRTRLLMLLFATLASCLLANRKRIGLLILATALLFVFIPIIARQMDNKTVISRIDLNEENYSTVQSRLNQIKTSVYLLSQKPLGVGLGNYYEYLPSSEKRINQLGISKLQMLEFFLGKENVHNIFGLIGVESGIFALILLITLTMLFIVNDYRLIKSMDRPKIVLMIGFWSMFIYALFNPLIPGVSNYLFWFLRGVSLSEIRKHSC